MKDSKKLKKKGVDGGGRQAEVTEDAVPESVLQQPVKEKKKKKDKLKVTKEGGVEKKKEKKKKREKQNLEAEEPDVPQNGATALTNDDKKEKKKEKKRKKLFAAQQDIVNPTVVQGGGEGAAVMQHESEPEKKKKKKRKDNREDKENGCNQVELSPVPINEAKELQAPCSAPAALLTTPAPDADVPKQEKSKKKKSKKSKKPKSDDEAVCAPNAAVTAPSEVPEACTPALAAPTAEPVDTPMEPEQIGIDDNYEEEEQQPAPAYRGFRRVKSEEWIGKKGSMKNSYEATFGNSGWGAKAQQVLGATRGKGFRHEKTKKKRGNYMGGKIDSSARLSFKYDSD